MKLYRVCKQNEGKTILEIGDFSSLGSNYSNRSLNGFHYDPGKRYLHFFRHFGDIHYLNLCEGYYICEYDIPDELLPSPCYGSYMDYVSFKNPDEVEEYVIESSQIKFEYLDEMNRILEYIDYEDYAYGDYAPMIERVYKKDSGIKYEKKLPQNE